MTSSGAEVYLEIQQTAGGLDVRAVDASDGLEVSFIAPVNTSRGQIEQLALSKLAYVRRKARGGSGGGPGGDGPMGGGDSGGGVLA